MTTEPISNVGRGLRLVGSFYGILMILFGLLALAAPIITTIATVILVGVALAAGGVVALFTAFTENSGSARWINALWGLLALGLGIWMIAQPGIGAASLTLLLGAVLAARGVTGLMLAFDGRYGSARIWLGLGGLLSLILGGMVLFNLMDMVGWTIGTFVGIDFLVSGVSLLIASMMGGRAVE